MDHTWRIKNPNGQAPVTALRKLSTSVAFLLRSDFRKLIEIEKHPTRRAAAVKDHSNALMEFELTMPSRISYLYKSQRIRAKLLHGRVR